jgi:glutamate/tyrosine decarboxylase-like PLP-dependent enzyme
MSDNDVRTLLTGAAARAIGYLDSLAERPVFPAAEAVDRLRGALDTPLPEGPAAAGDVLAFIDAFGTPATVASAGGRYFGFVTGGALPATVAANWLAAAWDQNSFSVVSSPAVAAFEDAALRWLKQALELPMDATGTLVTGATMANFTGLAAARHRVLADAGWDVEANGLFGAPEVTVIVGGEAHATLFKVLGLLGLGRARVMTVPADRQGRMMADALPETSGPTILCLQAGNVNSGAFDPAAAIIPQAKERGAWVHVDGAFGLWARASDTRREMAAGFENADSWATDCHKWLNVPYDCGAAIVRDGGALQAAMSITGAYLIPSAQRDALDVTPDSSRRARALDVWAALKSLGRAGLAEMIDRHCRQAEDLADRLRDTGAEILNDVVLNQVVAAFGDDSTTDAVIARLQDSGAAWAGGTTWQGRQAMRISISAWATTDDDMDRTYAAIQAGMKQV